MAIQVTRENIDGAVVVALGGSVDIYTSTELRGELKVALDAQAPKLIVDMADVTFVDSSGLATLIEALQRIKRYEGSLSLCNLSKNVRGVFELANLDSIFDIKSSREAALGG